MLILICGLILFLGMHLTRLLAEQWRAGFIERRGDNAWKAMYSVVSLVGLVLIVYGYGQARQTAPWLWSPPASLTYVAWLLTLISFVLLVASQGPNNPIRAAVGHPMAAGVKIWAFAHLLVNGGLADIVLFGSFLFWAVFLYTASRRRDRRDAVVRVSAGGTVATVRTIAIGVVVWVVFVAWAHRFLIGVSPMVLS